jgi:hypothetical protein
MTAIGPLSINLCIGATVGFVAMVVLASALNQFGDAMFRRGVAKPFFVGRRRLHHKSFLFGFLPAAYLVLSTLILTGVVKIVWSLFWTGLASTLVIAVSCLLVDLAFDSARQGGGWGYIHHELVYLLVPAFAFSDFLRIVI